MPNVAGPLRAHLRPSHSRLLERASAVAAGLRVELYLAGGAVRDALLAVTPDNLDIVVVRPRADFAERLAREVGGEVTLRSQFGTYKLLVACDEIDVATARREEYPRPGALPIVEASSIEEDLGRRDFSINSMAVSLNRDSWGELLDLHGGEDDLGRGFVRVLHGDSFVDDATRILRAVRYAVRLGFRLDAGDAEAAEERPGSTSTTSAATGFGMSWRGCCRSRWRRTRCSWRTRRASSRRFTRGCGSAGPLG